MCVGDREDKEHEVRVNKCRSGEILDNLECQEPMFLFHRISQRKILRPKRLGIHRLNHPVETLHFWSIKLTEVTKVYLHYLIYQNMLSKITYQIKHFFSFQEFYNLVY